ncbi:hypothetical protein D3H35_14390 [Cohnella faecalis]|uniref:LysR substrate-binding domain-containing protein n=2 Tax=Cohnella faecalis TaxID=2315694 RepID=A0A398CV41_9BACL|nr:hypothetical protein D3H35_14390 [Cohnella faecalis]
MPNSANIPRLPHACRSRLSEDAMYIAVGAGHPLANTASVAPERLSEQTWLVREIGSGTRAATEGMFAEFGIHPSG